MFDKHLQRREPRRYDRYTLLREEIKHRIEERRLEAVPSAGALCFRLGSLSESSFRRLFFLPALYFLKRFFPRRGNNLRNPPDLISRPFSAVSKQIFVNR